MGHKKLFKKLVPKRLLPHSYALNYTIVRDFFFDDLTHYYCVI